MISTRATRDRPRLAARLVHDQAGLLARLLLERDGRLLRGHERRAQERLELAIPHEVGFELLDLVREVRALAPDVLEADDDLVEQLVDGTATVAAEQCLRRLEMSDLDWSESHGLPFQCRRPSNEFATRPRMTRKRTPTTGERSSGPNVGRIRRKSRR